MNRKRRKKKEEEETVKVTGHKRSGSVSPVMSVVSTRQARKRNAT